MQLLLQPFITFIVLFSSAIVLSVLAQHYSHRKVGLWEFACIIPTVGWICWSWALLIIMDFESGYSVIATVSFWLLFISGPLGILLTWNMEFGTPYDVSWSYFMALLLATSGQWLLIWFIGKKLINRNDGVRLTKTITIGSMFLFMLVCGLVHGYLYFYLCAHYFMEHPINGYG